MPDSDRILVVGGTGYVGRRLVPRLIAARHPLRLLVRDPSAVSYGDDAAVLRGDITDPSSLAAACDGVGTVVNLAAVTADRKPPKGGYDAVNDLGVRALVEAAARSGVRRFVQMGGIDTAPGQPGPYLAGRRRGEQAVRDSGLDWALLRPSIMFGGSDSAFVTALGRLVRFAPIVPVPGDGRLLLQLIWVDDVAHCLEMLVGENAPSGPLPVGGPDQLTYDEVLDLIGEGLGRRRVLKAHVPMGLMRLQAAMIQILPQPPLTPAALELFASDNITAVDAVERTFGFQPRSFRSHVREHGLKG